MSDKVRPTFGGDGRRRPRSTPPAFAVNENIPRGSSLPAGLSSKTQSVVGREFVALCCRHGSRPEHAQARNRGTRLLPTPPKGPPLRDRFFHRYLADRRDDGWQDQ